jgi:hypothetical protein
MIVGMSSGFLVNDGWPKVAGKEERFLAIRKHGSKSPIERLDRKHGFTLKFQAIIILLFEKG